ncbi:MAG: hypothetical protein R3C16_12285, partial [Hyphomonadaceae bacterium]
VFARAPLSDIGNIARDSDENWASGHGPTNYDLSRAIQKRQVIRVVSDAGHACRSLIERQAMEAERRCVVNNLIGRCLSYIRSSVVLLAPEQC